MKTLAEITSMPAEIEKSFARDSASKVLPSLGEAHPDSDWDFFVVTDQEPPYPERRNIAARIRRRFVEVGFWGDVCIQLEETVIKRRTNTGFLTCYVLKEGVEI